MDERREMKTGPKADSARKKPQAKRLPVAKALGDRPTRSKGAKPSDQPAGLPRPAPPANDRHGDRHDKPSVRGMWAIGAAAGVGVLVVVVLIAVSLNSGDGKLDSNDQVSPVSTANHEDAHHEESKPSQADRENNRENSGREQSTKNVRQTGRQVPGGQDDIHRANGNANANSSSSTNGNDTLSQPRSSAPSIRPRRIRPFPNVDTTSSDLFVEIQQSLGRREMANGRAQLDQLAKQSGGIRRSSQQARLRTLYQNVSHFWERVIAAAHEAAVGTELRYADSRFVITAVDSTAISIRKGQINTDYPYDTLIKKLPTKLAMALCGTKLQSGDLHLRMCAGTFLAIDDNGDIKVARMLCAQASRSGVDCAAVLPALGLDDLESLAVVETQAISMLFADAPTTAQAAADQPIEGVDARMPVPSSGAQKQATAKVRAVFESEYAAAQSAAGRIALASKLFAQAKATQSDAVARWALLSECRRLSTIAGEVPLLMSVVRMQATHYRIDRLKEAVVALRSLLAKSEPLRSRSVPTRMAAAQAIVEQMLLTADDAIAADEYGIAMQLSRLASSAARKVNDRLLSRMAAASQKKTSHLERQWQTTVKAQKKLDKDPADPMANYRLGRYQCLIKENWEEGLPLLAKSSPKGPSAALRRVAKADLTNPTKVEHQIKLADAWWNLAKSARAREKPPLARRARGWYFKALEKVANLEKVQVEKRLKEIDVVLAQAEASGSPTGGQQLIVPLGSGVTIRFQLMPRGKLSTNAKTKPITIDRPFYIGVTEVTQAQWQAVMGNNPSSVKAGPDFPVTRINLKDCLRFVKKLNAMSKGRYRFRLPTESQWAYACRAGTTTAYSFGNDPSQLSQYAWFQDNAAGATHAVGLLKPNPAGLYDMTGNVWEWCQGGIIRGGCYHRPTKECRWDARSDYSAKDAHDSAIGLRLVIDF